MIFDIHTERVCEPLAFRPEDCEALLGHANHSMAGHYASPDGGRLLAQANLVIDRSGPRTLLRIAESERGRGQKVPHGPTAKKGGLGFRCQVI